MILLDLWRRLFRRKRKRSFITPDASFIPEIWAKELHESAREEAMLSELVSRAYMENLAAGDVLRIPHLGNVVVQDVRVKEELVPKPAGAGAPYSIQQVEEALQDNRLAYESFMRSKMEKD